jgi:hypothetical protein
MNTEAVKKTNCTTIAFCKRCKGDRSTEILPMSSGIIVEHSPNKGIIKSSALAQPCGGATTAKFARVSASDQF